MKKNTFVSSLFVVFISLSVQTNTQKISVHLLTGHSCTLEKKGGVETREKNRPQKNFGEKKISKKALLDAQYDFDDFDARMTVTPPTGGGVKKVIQSAAAWEEHHRDDGRKCTSSEKHNATMMTMIY